MMKNLNGMKHSVKSMTMKLVALLLVVGLLPAFALAEETPASGGEWVTFLLVCNEGMVNGGGNSGNTMMVVGMHPETGLIRLMMMTWDTFIEYEGYDVPQKLDMPYRNKGPEETMKVFNANFGTDIGLYMSLNYLNLASLIDTYGGVDVDITRAERNALNGMVGSKAQKIKDQANAGLLSQMIVDSLAKEYYLNDYGPDTHLNGLQAVGFGWLQYDSVYNCCEREVNVIADLFSSVSKTIGEKVALYTNDTGAPENTDGRRVVNLDEITDDDMVFLRQQIAPIFEMAENNLTDEDIDSISLTLARTAYEASRQGVDIFDSLDTKVLPLEAQEEYDVVAGAKGHLVDYEANKAAIMEFLYTED